MLNSKPGKNVGYSKIKTQCLQCLRIPCLYASPCVCVCARACVCVCVGVCACVCVGVCACVCVGVTMLADVPSLTSCWDFLFTCSRAQNVELKVNDIQNGEVLDKADIMTEQEPSN